MKPIEKTTRKVPIICLALLGLLSAPEARAQEVVENPAEDVELGFFEGYAGYGGQFGVTSYLPQGSPTLFKHPLVTGPSFGATAGWRLIENLYVIANYEYVDAFTRTGSIDNAVDEIKGSIEYHTAVIGLRLGMDIFWGQLYIEFAAGMVFPFQTKLRFDYADALSQLPDPIVGEGRRITRYNIGVGGHGQIGYRYHFLDWLYATAAIKLRTFQSTNSGKEQTFSNFVADFEQVPPQTVTRTIKFDREGGPVPSTESVQDVKGILGVGVTF